MDQISNAEAELELSRYRSFARKMPPMYAYVCVNMAAQIYVFHSVAPWFISVLMPAAIGALAAWRGIWWVIHGKVEIGLELARRRLSKAIKLLFIGSVLGIFTAFLLFSYCDVDRKYFLVFTEMSYGLSFYICIVHLNKTAMIILFSFVLTAMVLSFSIGSDTSRVYAIAILGLAIAVRAVTAIFDQDFMELSRTKCDLRSLGEENVRLASLDLLTNLPNRRYFFQALATEIENVAIHGGRLAIGIVDLDGFKPVNDTYGHRVGDKVLAGAAKRLASARPEIVEFCRVGGDEFAFLQRLEGNDQSFIETGNALVEALECPVIVDDRIITVSCSIGFAIYPDTADTADLLFERADFALHHAKQAGRGHVEVFSPGHEAEIASKGRIEQALRTANLDAELYNVFQPIVDVENGEIIAFECLARWQSPALGPMSPGIFIPVAEQAGLVSKLTLILLRGALTAMRDWPPSVDLSFNLSSHDIIDSQRTMQIISMVCGSGIDPSRIAFELTETALMHDFALAQRNIATLKMAGVCLSLDDFGTGYSSLSHVQSLPLDKLKIDRRFVTNIETDPTSQAIVRSLVALCKGIGITCIAEGAETSGQIEALKTLDCGIVQGYFYSGPMSAVAVNEFLRKGDKRLADVA